MGVTCFTPRPIKVVYFYHEEYQPCEGYENRLLSIMENIQDFYRKAILNYLPEHSKSNHPNSFALEKIQDKLKIYMIEGKRPINEYAKKDRNGKVISDNWNVKNDVWDYLYENDIFCPDNEVVLIFTPFFYVGNNNNNDIIDFGPFSGLGRNYKGFACAMDHPKLDPVHLKDKSSSSCFGKLTLSQFNSKYLGGIAHELGHAFTLPDHGETDDEKTNSGTAIMGEYNLHYGEEEREDGKGVFLSETDVYRLSKVQAFSWDIDNEKCCLCDIQSQRLPSGKFEITGRVNSDQVILRMCAYLSKSNDQEKYDKFESEYTSYPYRVNFLNGDSFELLINSPLNADRNQLRLETILENGTSYQFLCKFNENEIANNELKTRFVEKKYPFY